ncbi:MAG TPA: ABC transporter ATP-binding protein, partial [Dermatophilaceae bacterium]|nr:ABC transporter ATP-binding protein [Dermatophilaceae bacterium]
MTPAAGSTDHARRSLPIAARATVLAHVRVLFREHRRALALLVGWHGLAALVGLVAPWVVGQVVDEVAGDRSTARVDVLLAVLAAAVAGQGVLTWFARRSAFVFAEGIFARLREDFIADAVRLPLSTVERAGTGDLVARTTNDVEALARVIRFGVPAIVVSVTTVLATVVAAAVTAPLPALALVLPAVLHLPATWWYLRRAGNGYLWEHATYARLNGVASETVEGARTVEALSLQDARRERFEEAVEECYRAERYTLGLRMRWYPCLDLGFIAPVAGAILWGGWLAWNGHTTIGAATAVVLYLQLMLDPLGEVVDWLDEIQFAGTSLARILGVAEVPPDRAASGELPRGDDISVRGVRYAYRAGRDVLHGVDLDLRPRERLAVV